MVGVVEFSLSVAAAYAHALAAWPILGARCSNRRLLATSVGVTVLFWPLLIPAEGVVSRSLAAFLCIELMCKMLDYARQHRSRNNAGCRFADFVRFLIPFPSLLVIFGHRERRLPRQRPFQRDAIRVFLGAGVFASGLTLVGLVAHIPAVRASFPLDHATKVAIFIVTIEALSNAVYGVERLAGFDTTPVIRNGFLSRTVAEFWWRYNTRVHGWLEYNVFRPSGGRRAPVRGVWLTFFVSAVLHELMFGMTTSRFDGYQFTFFMLQAPAVLLSRPLGRFERRAGMLGKAAAHGVTIVWMFVTSVLFFHGVNRIFPSFYASEPWLP